MNNSPFKTITTLLLSVSVSAGLSFSAVSAEQPQIIELTQVSCQFLESENGTDHGFISTSAEDCKTQNEQTGEQRLENAKTITLAPGKYIFRVTNKNVPYDLGFWLRGKGIIGYASLPSVSGGGLSTGKTLDYEVELKKGEYVYSCPLNPTPDYNLVVN
ncbi:hypothetical protein [Motiliproteus sp. MSK22-1]|uniref:hypothetical protein n=1 Tax=Motiliproteus sp. MSK22-1 TaxID=1897630 RepID=UPI00097696F2|nr:hypothetical protein [Motiliproteus sp. MSK22-1]OMH33754.1 hypothetical protein BGP75_12210 [Motiliproteus sp. MSK22-1]